MEMKDMTDQLFINDSSDYLSDQVCPLCNGEDVEAYDSEFVTDGVIQFINCHSCGSKYSVTYHVASTYVIRDGRFN